MSIPRIMSRLNWVPSLLMAIGTVLFLLQFHASFEILVDPRSPGGTYGTSKAPYSDALVPWLEGTLGYYFFHQPGIEHLYRPTVGMMFSSILSAAGRIDAMPWFFCILLLTCLSALFLCATSTTRAVLAIWLILMARWFRWAVLPLNPAAFMVDFPAFVLTCLGLLLVIGAAKDAKSSPWTAGGGFLLLGLSAAIRGPMMAGGGLLLLIAGTALWRRGWRWELLPAAVFFLAPLVMDVVVQRAYGITNNGIENLYCVYTDPSNHWTVDSSALFHAMRPTTGEVLRNYLGFVMSRAGFLTVVEGLRWRAAQDAEMLVSALFLVAAAALTVFGIWRSSAVASSSSGWTRPRDILPAAARLALLLLTALLMIRFPWHREILALLLTAVVGGVSIRHGLVGACCCAGVYGAGLLFVSLIRLEFLPRVTATFSFALPLAFLFFLVERRKEDEDGSGRRWTGVAVACVAVVAFLYAGNLCIPAKSKQVYRSAVLGQNAALKISDDRRIDRSLYFTGDQRLIYTHWDPSPVSSVRRFREVTVPKGCGNGSFISPAEFHD